MTSSLQDQIAAELGVRPAQVRAAVALLDSGATVPFIARYRKEVTGTLDDAQLRTLQDRLQYLRELADRRATILESISASGRLDDALRAAILAADSKARLEDIYLPFRPKRRTKAALAREAGLQPLADLLLGDPSHEPALAAGRFLTPESGLADTAAALEGARAILVERFAEDADLIGELRQRLWSRGRLVARVRSGRELDGAKYRDYFDYSGALTQLPSHRILALFRAEKEEVLSLSIESEDAELSAQGLPTGYEGRIAARFGIAPAAGRPGDRWLGAAVGWAWRTRILPHLSIDLRVRLREAAEEAAVRVFAGNLRDLLLAAPAGARATMGLDPGLRTGVKVAVVDATGRVVATETVHPHVPARRWDEAVLTLSRLASEHDVELIAIGNGTASRETEKLAAAVIAAHGGSVPGASVPGGSVITKVVVSEAGASVYSASAFAAAELPDLDVSLRGAVSIARRLQDPLAELVKIDPKSIGVGQYQHDLPESSLSRSLDAVVEDCVNAVGVDVNTASVPLLARVSGLAESVAANIVAHRDERGPFRSRAELRAVPRLGAKAFEQAAGFLRIRDGSDPLDASAVHPESYPLVRRMVAAAGVGVEELLGNTAVLARLRPHDFVDDKVGLPTVTDIIGELDKPGRDPRPAFRTAVFAEGIETLADLATGLVLEGTVTNVAAFGAFVDIGVHQDGLVHISALANTFVRDPRDVVKPGDVVRVKVVEVDQQRKRIGLTMRLADEPATSPRSDSDGGSNAPRGVAPTPHSDAAPTPRRDDAANPQRRKTAAKPRREGEMPPRGRRGASRAGSATAEPVNSAMAEALRRAGLSNRPGG